MKKALRIALVALLAVFLWWSVYYTITQQKRETYCGTVVGHYASSGKYSSTEYLIIRYDSIGVREEIVSVADYTLKQAGDRVCYRLRDTDIIPNGPLIILSLLGISIMITVCIIGFVVGVFKLFVTPFGERKG